MDPQPTQAISAYSLSELPGTFTAATIGHIDSSVPPVVENLLLSDWTKTHWHITSQELRDAWCPTAERDIHDKSPRHGFEFR